MRSLPEKWREVGFYEAFERLKLKSYEIPSKDYQVSGRYPIIDQGDGVIAGYIDREGPISSIPFIVFGDHTTIVKYVDKPCFIGSQGVVPLKAMECYDPYFLYLMLGRTRIPALGYSRHFRELENKTFPLPPIAEQRKIAEILRTWDEAIETAESELKAKQSLLKLAVDKYFERTYRDAASGTVGGLKTLDAVCTRKGEYGAAVSACPFNPEWPRYIRITDITDTGMLKKVRSVSISPESAEGYNLKIGDLLFARTGEPGRCLIFNEAYPAAFAGYLIRFKVRQEIVLSDFVYFYTLSSVYDKWVGDVSQKGAQANINAKVYGSLQLPVTDLASQGVAVRVFKALQESVLLAERGVELLSAQKRGLMQKLLTGEVRVAA